MLNSFRLALVVTLVVFLTACGVVPKQLHARDRVGAEPRKIVILFDGTANDEKSDTNIKKLHALIALRDVPNASVIYIEGVGTKAGVSGMAFGTGMEKRVKLAYEFLLKEYRHGTPTQAADEIYLFGFSRGAYAARILAAMLYHAGLPRWDPLPPGHTRNYPFIADSVHTAYYADRNRSQAAAQVASWGKGPGNNVQVKVLALFDTVEAMGAPVIYEHVGDVNPKHGDQLCNVEKVLHAVSLDDNRAILFTPKLFNRSHLVDKCAPDMWTNVRGDEVKLREAQSAFLETRVEEVWFSGAHSDVGGGYEDTLLGGISMNWMLRRLTDTGLFAPGARVREDYLDRSRDAEDQHLLGAYTDRPRSIHTYYAPGPGALPHQKLKIHRSVLDRYIVAQREAKNVARIQEIRAKAEYYSAEPAKVKHEYTWVKSYPQCFSGAEFEKVFQPGPACPIEVVDCEWSRFSSVLVEGMTSATCK